MSAAVVVPLPTSSLHDDASALARKRRREILSSQRTFVPDLTTSIDSSEDDDDSCPSSKRRCVGGKKPQMKYDPDVPMSREAAAVWRREQRRKRNRESAAASRQRQRDRIAELEIEIQEFQDQYNKVMRKVQAMEDLTNMTDDLIDSLPIVSPIATITSFSIVTGKDLETDATVVSDSESDKETEHHHQYKMISRPAVKITDDDAPPIDSMMLPVSMCPDPCLSTKKDDVVEMSDDAVSCKQLDKEPVVPFLLKDEETEFDAFLLDAVEWL